MESVVIIIANGMLRSGSTLQYNIAAMVMEMRGSLQRSGFMGDFSKPETRAKLDKLKAAEGWSIVKTHEAPLPREFYNERVRVLFSYRDVRDIAASIRKKWDPPFEKILSQIDAMIEIKAAFAEIPGVLMQPYDLLFHDIPSATRQIAHHLGAEVTDAEVCAIANALSVNALNNTGPEDVGFFSRFVSRIVRRDYDNKTLLHADHISATGGRDGDWANQFSGDEIARLEAHYSEWLKAHDYRASHCS